MLPARRRERREPGEVGELGEVISINKRKKKVSLLQATDENKVTNLTSGFHRESTLIGSANATQTDYRHIP